MYENGRRINGYAKKSLHKRKLKRGYLFCFWGYPQYKSYQDYLSRHDSPHDEYWQRVYVSGSRKLAKTQTSRKVRRHFRQQMMCADYDELPSYRGSDYRKHFDYWWTVW